MSITWSSQLKYHHSHSFQPTQYIDSKVGHKRITWSGVEVDARVNTGSRIDGLDEKTDTGVALSVPSRRYQEQETPGLRLVHLLAGVELR